MNSPLGGDRRRRLYSKATVLRHSDNNKCCGDARENSRTAVLVERGEDEQQLSHTGNNGKNGPPQSQFVDIAGDIQTGRAVHQTVPTILYTLVKVLAEGLRRLEILVKERVGDFRVLKVQ